MGPRKASEQFLIKNKNADHFEVVLYGSLAATGLGHLTDLAIKEIFKNFQCKIIWEPKIFLPKHPNALKFSAFNSAGKLLEEWTAYSVGGGTIIDDKTETETRQIYPHKTLHEIMNWCNQNGKQYWEYVEEVEGNEIWGFLDEVWAVMQDSITRGLNREGVLPGVLKLPRKAQSFYLKGKNYATPFKRRSQLFSYALAVSEENASGGKIVAAPTCGACGVLPAVLEYSRKVYKSDKTAIFCENKTSFP
jgi:L-serine dehydratase